MPRKAATDTNAAKEEKEVKATEEKEVTKTGKRGRTSKKEDKAAPEKTAEKKATTTRKATTRKTAAKAEGAVEKEIVKKEVTPVVNLQFGGKSYSVEDLQKIAGDVWKFDWHKEEEYTSLELYVKPEESVVYYVFNGDITGHFSI